MKDFPSVLAPKHTFMPMKFFFFYLCLILDDFADVLVNSQSFFFAFYISTAAAVQCMVYKTVESFAEQASHAHWQKRTHNKR